MTALRDAYRNGAQLSDKFGVVHPIASSGLTTTTVICNTLKMGEASSAYQNWYILRPYAASSVDRVRQVIAFDGSTGTLTHAGANYSDTTETSEYILLTPFSPVMIDQCAQRVLGECRRFHRDIIPAHGGDTYYLEKYSWVQHRGHVQRLLYGGPSNLVRNPFLDDWNTVHTDGSLRPNLWTLSGSGATFARATTNPWRSPYELSVTRSGTDAVVGQSMADVFGTRALLGDGVDSLIGTTLYARLIFRSDLTSNVFITLSDGVSSGFSDTQVALDGTHVYAETSYTLQTTGTRLTIEATVATDGTAFLSGFIVADRAIDDALMRGAGVYNETGFGWQDRPPALRPDYRLGRARVYTLETWRPYPDLDTTRLLAGSADADESDIDADLWSTGILAHVFESAGAGYEVPARRFRAEYDALRGASRWDVRPSPLRRGTLGPALRRV